MKTVKQRNTDEIFPYIAYIPDEISDHPALLVHLHGAGERGCGGDELERVLVHGFPKVVNDSNFKNCILIMPQCPEDSFWTAKIESLKSFVDHMMAKYSADTSRIYLCGLSMGGYGTWHLAMAYPNLFAAIAPCCGGGMAWYAFTLNNLPIWAFHGLDDAGVLPIHTIEMIDALKDKNPYLKYDLYEGVGHAAWEKGFSEETLAWILEQKKAQ